METLRHLLSLLFLFWSFLKVYVIAVPCLLSQVLRNIKCPPELDTIVDRETVAIVTGAGSGIGFEISKHLAKLGVHIIMGVKENDDLKKAVSRIKSGVAGSKVEALHLDLCDFSSVRKFAKEFLSRDLPLHILVNNAGVMLKPKFITKDGFEEHLQVNYLGHYLLTQLLLECLKSSGQPGRHARVVNMSSHVHYVGNIYFNDLNLSEVYSPHAAYAQSKLALLLFSNKLQRVLSDESSYVTANSVHPGVVDTDLFRYTSSFTKILSAVVKWMYKSPQQGAYTPLYVALARHLDGIGGRYFDNCEECVPSNLPSSIEDKLWIQTRHFIGLDSH